MAGFFDPQAAQIQAQVFQQLRPVCVHLLHMRTDPTQLHNGLKSLLAVLRGCDPRGLSACWDYVMVPLTVILESVTAARQPPPGADVSNIGQDGSSATMQQSGPATIAVPAASHDRVAEDVLDCILIMLHRAAQGREPDQLLPLLQRCAPLLQLSRDVATEELRLKSFQCLSALLQPLQAAMEAAASANTCDSTDTSTALATSVWTAADIETQVLSKVHSAPGTSISFMLQQPDLAPLVGVLIHSCLAAAQQELAAAHLGSKTVRAAALQALGTIIDVVGSADVLAFFLPGVASGMAKQLMASGEGGAGVMHRCSQSACI